MKGFSERNGQLVLTISRDDLDSSNGYIGLGDVAVPFGGHIELEAGLGLVRFDTSVHASLSIRAGVGTGIETRGYLQAGELISAGGDLRAAWDIIAGYAIEAKRSVVAGELIRAGWHIEAGESVQAGLSIEAEGISAGGRILAGVMPWPSPCEEDRQIRADIWAGEVVSGVVVPPAAQPDVPWVDLAKRVPRGVR